MNSFISDHITIYNRNYFYNYAKHRSKQKKRISVLAIKKWKMMNFKKLVL